ncbi:unnamed protein product [Alopecurus aequalis]
MTAKAPSKDGGNDCKPDEGRAGGGRAAKHHALLKLRALMTSAGRNRQIPRSDGQTSEGANKYSKQIRSMFKLQASYKALEEFCEKECDAEEEHYGRLPDRPSVSYTTFEERQFGDPVTWDVARHFPCSVVSIALFDGDTMLFACSGIPLPCSRRAKLNVTRLVTSARLAREYMDKRYRDDKLKIEVRLPDNEKIGGLVELYNRHIAIVTLFGRQSFHPVDVELQTGCPSSDGEMLVAGRAFESGCLMAAKVKLVPCGDDVGLFDQVRLQVDLPTSQERLSIWKPAGSYEGGPLAVLGGPVLGEDNRIIGMSIEVGHDGPSANACASFLPLPLLCRYLKHFGILNPEELHFRGYVLPDSVYTIVPSGWMRRINRIKHFGYPMPPPLMLELDGELRNQFEECFGESLAWKGYPFPVRRACFLGVWKQIRKDVVKDISRRVVSIASFHGYERYFVCTGLLIKWHRRTVVLTSASLVRSCNNEDEIDNTLTIEVFLPPKQRASGRLELYNFNYNIAIVSIERKFISVCPEDISIKDSTPKPSGKVVAVGREPRQGLLIASIGEVKRRDKDCKLDCKDLMLSTCETKKVGIGGPLIDFDGNFVGMNYFDGRMLTPFLPRSKIAQVLGSKINRSLPSERGAHVPVHFKYADGEPRENRWPVPETYWYHRLLDVDRDEHRHVGRHRHVRRHLQ